MGRLRRSRNQREEVGVITNEWVEANCTRVTERDREILKLLGQFSIMSSRHLYQLVPPAGKEQAFRDISNGQQRCNDRLRVLYDLHCVNKHSPLLPPGSGTSVQYIWLDRAGARILGIENFRRRKTLPQDYLHSARLLDTYCVFKTMEREGVLEIKYEGVEAPQKTWPLIPDLLYVLRMNKKGYMFLIEVDRCEKKEKEELEKIQSYRDWQLSNQWLQEEWAKVMPVPRFPRIIYVFDEDKAKWKGRAKRFQTFADANGLRFSTCGISELQNVIGALAI